MVLLQRSKEQARTEARKTVAGPLTHREGTGSRRLGIAALPAPVYVDPCPSDEWPPVRLGRTHMKLGHTHMKSVAARVVSHTDRAGFDGTVIMRALDGGLCGLAAPFTLRGSRVRDGARGHPGPGR